ncbi:unnamed protein product [Angiostrongylus costaricensis]|uniref:NopRA1 domain-containing protein n=1 Tax=Angiostrongylus costaricensis TaxID=334426 RepID=A0A0R3Q040_ANGCS|nr:unnamed protein product [Angiostrongylus costaricensis]
MKRKKEYVSSAHKDVNTTMDEHRPRDSWTTIKDAILDSSLTPLHIERLSDYLRSQKDDHSAREAVQRSVDFQFLSQILISYNATTSSTDRSIFDVMDLLENTYKVNMSVISPVVWGENSREIYRKRRQFGGTLSRTTPNEVLELLDGLRMWKTVLNHSRSLFSVDTGEMSLYDELDVDAVEDRHKYLYIYLLRIFKQSIESVAPRLSHMVSHFFSRVSKLFLHPESPLFSPVLSFLSLKPVIDLNNVPELYKLLLSSSTDHHHQEREWILSLISESLIEPMDYNLLQNRSGVKLLLSLFPTCMLNMASRRLILAILKSAVQMPSVAHDLFYRMNLHSWIASIITVLLAMNPLNDKPAAVDNIEAIQSTVEAKWHPKQRRCAS